jgi:hypothetical protein
VYSFHEGIRDISARFIGSAAFKQLTLLDAVSRTPSLAFRAL